MIIVLRGAYSSEWREDLCHNVTVFFALITPISHPESVVRTFRLSDMTHYIKTDASSRNNF